MSVSLYYPYIGSATTSIVLRNPDLGNTENYDNSVTYHRAQDGTIYSYKKRKKQTLSLSFSALTKAKIEELESFYIANIGRTIGYTDTLGVTWKVNITNELEYTADRGRGNCQLFSTTIEMLASEAGGIYEYSLIDDNDNILVDNDGNVLVFA